MTVLVATLGLPASGKSTYAKELATEKGHVRVNKDDLRAMLHCGLPWSREQEDVTSQVSDTLIFMLLNRGHNVVCDDTNFERLDWLRDIAENANASFEVSDLTAVPVEECIRRDDNRRAQGQPNVGAAVIVKMAERNGLI